MDNRKFNEELILRYKETCDESLFEQIVKDQGIKSFINSVCYQKIRNYPSHMMSQEDFVNISYLVLWQCIQNFRFKCPICGIQAKTESVYKMHMTAKHNDFIEPAISITRYIKYNIGAYLQNELRREYSEERQSNVMTINIFSPQSDDEICADRIEFESNNDSEDIIGSLLFRETIKEATDKFDTKTKEIFTLMFVDNLRQNDIANKLYNEGKYASEQSASVVVSRTVRNKIYPVIREIIENSNL